MFIIHNWTECRVDIGIRKTRLVIIYFFVFVGVQTVDISYIVSVQSAF